jgi:hypothetical protein
MTFSKILFSCFFGYILTGCGAGPTPRLIELVGEDAFARSVSLSKGADLPGPGNDEWRQVPGIGLVVHSDATGQHAAPAIISGYLETLARRTEEFLRQRCSFQEIVTVPSLSRPVNFSEELKVQGQRLQVPYTIVVLFSSRERSGPQKIGEATMMTQMTGTVIENSALAEVGILRVSDFTMVFFARGWATESLEQLDVPIGTNQPSATEARDILRARAGQYALDRALEHVGSACRNGK